MKFALAFALLLACSEEESAPLPPCGASLLETACASAERECFSGLVVLRCAFEVSCVLDCDSRCAARGLAFDRCGFDPLTNSLDCLCDD